MKKKFNAYMTSAFQQNMFGVRIFPDPSFPSKGTGTRLILLLKFIHILIIIIEPKKIRGKLRAWHVSWIEVDFICEELESNVHGTISKEVLLIAMNFTW